MESQAQKVEALKKRAKYRRHVMKKKKHERSTAQVRENEELRGIHWRRPDFDTHKIYAPKEKLKKVTTGRLSVPRGLFLKGKASSLLKKKSDTYLNALNCARKKEELGQIIKIGMDQAQKIGSRGHHKLKTSNNGPMKGMPEETEGMNDGTEITQEAKRKKNVNRIKTVLGLADPGPSFTQSPTSDALETQFTAGGIPTPVCPLVKMKAHEKNESPRPSPTGLDSSQGMRPPERETPETSCNMLDVGEIVDELDDLILEKLVSDIGLYAWNSQKPSSEPYENCDETLIKEIISVMDETTNDIAKYNKVKKPELLTKISEITTSLPFGLPQSTPKNAEMKFPAYTDEAQSHRTAYKQTGFAPEKSIVQQKYMPTQRHYDVPVECRQDLFVREEAATHIGGAESSDDEPPVKLPVPVDTCFVSPSTPPISVQAFDPKALMRNVEVHRRPQEEPRYRLGDRSSTDGSCSSTLHFARSEDGEASVKSDDSDTFSGLYKYRRSMY